MVFSRGAGHHRVMRALVLACSVFTIGLAGPVRADVISEPPPRCPEGSAAEFCHGPPTCRTRDCASNADCAATEVCAPRMLCTRMHSCGGRLIDPTYTHAIGACGSSCDAEGGTCSTLNVCVPRTSMTDAGPRPVDGGPGRVDAGRVDAGPPVDAGRVDAGPRPIDAGPGGSGGSGSDRGGCGCQLPGAAPGGAAAMLFAGVAALVVARRRGRAR